MARAAENTAGGGKRALTTWLRRGVAGGLLGCGLALALALPLGGPARGNTASACGLAAGPTMLANAIPAQRFPAGSGAAAGRPLGIFAPDYAVGSAIAFSVDLSRVSSAPDPTSVKWRWIYGDGAIDTSGSAPSHIYKKPGTYTIHAQTYDSGRKVWAELDSAQIHVIAALPLNPPVARASASAPMVTLGGSITFDASGSAASSPTASGSAASSPTAAGSSPLTYNWNFSDGQTATGAQVTHQFAVAGKGPISLTVTDAQGARAVTTLDVVVAQSELGASARTVAPGKSLTFNETQVGTPGTVPALPTNQGVSYGWSFGDGTPDQTTPQPTITHSFARTGQYIVILQEFDGQTAGPFEAVTVTVAVPAAPPWRYYIGGAAVALGILVSLLAAARTQWRQIAIAEQRKRERARARRGGPSARGRGGRADAYGFRGGYQDDEEPRGGYAEEYRSGRSSRSRAPEGRAGRRHDDHHDDRYGGARQRPSPRQRRSRDDEW
ncbi:MAG: PKD domain-containing protein [Ktedonobacterales bacterium]|nr:PKD domain-containing protein [Ktedonobacterales bacterium]